MTKKIWNDLGFSHEKSRDMELRYQLMEGIHKIIKKHHYTQKELIIILGQKQPHISDLMRGKISEFSAEKLTYFLSKLEAEVTIEIRIPKKRLAVNF